MVFKSKFEDINPPAKFKDSLSKFFWQQLDVHAKRTLFVDFASGRQWTGAEIKSETKKIAHYLLDKFNLLPGDCCVLFYPHSDQILLVSLGILFAGASVCVGASLDPPAEHRHMIESMRPKVVFAAHSLYEELLELRSSLASEFNFEICIINATPGSLNGSANGLHGHLLNYKHAANNGRQSRQLLPVAVDPNQPAFVLFTSGSTGRPKPVGRSHRNSLNVCFILEGASQKELWDLSEDCVMANHLQLDHGTGTFSLKMALAKGFKLIIMDGFETKTILEAIERHQITDCMLGSALLHNFIGAPEVSAKTDGGESRISSLRNLLSVGSPIASQTLVNKFMDEHPHLSIRQTYGMTEAGFLSFVPEARCRGDANCTRSVGLLLPNVTIKLIDRSSGKEVHEPNCEGELFVAGPTISTGYLGAQYEEQSRDSFLADGFYRSHDIASMTADGLLVIRGRDSEILCLHDGWKVLPREIEVTLLEHPGIRECAVIGIAHPHLPTCHAPRAYVVPSDEWRDKLGQEEVIEFAANHLSTPKHLVGGVRIMQHLPLISVGKPDKRALRRLDGYC